MLQELQQQLSCQGALLGLITALLLQQSLVAIIRVDKGRSPSSELQHAGLPPTEAWLLGVTFPCHTTAAAAAADKQLQLTAVRAIWAASCCAMLLFLCNDDVR